MRWKSEDVVSALIERLEDTCVGTPVGTKMPKRICEIVVESLEKIATPKALETAKKWRLENPSAIDEIPF